MPYLVDPKDGDLVEIRPGTSKELGLTERQELEQWITSAPGYSVTTSMVL